MAVIQISRLQVRRGKASSGTGIPQLASGEIAWVIDDQQLYIGNGSVAEGAPAVGNTKILTENDLTAQGNILTLIQHIYKVDDPSMQTGVSPNSPINRYLQDRLDDRVSLADFGAVGDNITNDTLALQRAIDQLYLNPSTIGTTSSRTIIEIPTGTYKITSTIYVPGYVTLVGAGNGASIIEYSGTGPVFQFVNATSTIGNPSSISSTLVSNQPRQITFKDFAIHTNTNNAPGLKLDAVVDSVFENIDISGEWGELYNLDSTGIALNAYTSLVTCQGNKFNNVSISGFSYGVSSKQDILNNQFTSMAISDVRQGFSFGEGSNGTSTGEQTGPTNNLIDAVSFENVKRHAVFIKRGRGNHVANCQVVDVGNDSGGHSTAKYPQIYFEHPSNEVSNLRSDRPTGLAENLLVVPYVPEVAGHGIYKSFSNRSLAIATVGSAVGITRLPISMSSSGVPINSIAYDIDYTFYSPASAITRHGILRVTVDIGAKKVQLSDEYNYAGPETATEYLALEFSARLLDEVGVAVTSSTSSIPYSLQLMYANSLDGGTVTFSYTSYF